MPTAPSPETRRALLGGGVYNDDGDGATTALANTIVANNAAGTASPDIYGTVTADYCLIEDGSGATINTDDPGSNISGVDPLFGARGSYGGPTQTIPLLPGSPAIDAGSNALIPSGVTTDQRGYARIFNGTVDIGAYEFSPLIVTTTADVVDPTDGLTSLREAVDYADANPGDNTITFDPSLAGQTITLTSGELDLTDTTGTDDDHGLRCQSIDRQRQQRLARVLHRQWRDCRHLRPHDYRRLCRRQQLRRRHLQRGHVDDHRLHHLRKLGLLDCGGGIETGGYGGTLTITDSTISGNSAGVRRRHQQ